jgi:hypothetical protein
MTNLGFSANGKAVFQPVLVNTWSSQGASTNWNVSTQE